MEVVEGCGGVGDEVVVDFGLDGVGGCFTGHGGYGTRTKLPPVKLLTVVVLYASVCRESYKEWTKRGEKGPLRCVAVRNRARVKCRQSGGASRLFLSFRSIRSKRMYSHNTAASFPTQRIRFQWWVV